MPKGFKIGGYILIGVISFMLFLYFTFPFNVLKDRIVAGVEKQLKGQYELIIDSVSPRLIFGITLEGVKLNKRGEGGLQVMVEAEKVRLKTSIFSLIFGSPTVKFDIRSGSSRLSGRIDRDKNKIGLSAKLYKFDLSKIPYLASEYGLHLKSGINGEIIFDINPDQIIRSSGTIKIEPNEIKLLASKIKAGNLGEIDFPPTTIGAGNSLISMELRRGAIKVESFKLEKGDLNINLDGSVYLSNNVRNLRLNLKGTFDFSEQFGQALPFLFIIEKQKNKEGSFPLTIAGRLAKPQIKIGDFTLPL